MVDPKAIELVSAAYAALARHPDLDAKLEQYAAQDARDGHRMSSKYYIERARRELRITPDRSESYGIRNAFSPVFSRILVRRHPEYAEMAHMGKSKVDGVFADEALVSAIEGHAAREEKDWFR